MSGAKSGFLGFLRDTAGNVLPMAAIAMLLSAALVGGGIDMSRAYRVKNRLQSACDAGSLAGRRAITTAGFDTRSQDQAKYYFETNFDQSSLEASNTAKSFSSPDNGQTVNGSASTELNLAVMKIFGFQKFSLAVTCKASMGVGNSDVVMVLDNTGSMDDPLDGSTRIIKLRAAMKNFYTTVKTATASSNARIRYGFVPFSSSVNVGRLLPAGYINDQWAIQSRLAVQVGATYDTTDDLDDGSKSNYGSDTYANEADCLKAKPTDTPWANDGAASNLGTTDKTPGSNGAQTWTTTIEQPQKRTRYGCTQKKDGSYKIQTWTQTQDYDTNTNWKWSYQPVTYDVSSYKTFASVSTNTGSYGGTVSSTWGGCIEERGSTNAATFAYVVATKKISPDASDLDIDSAPTSNATKWSPMWPQVAYARYSETSPTATGYPVSSYCPYKAQLLTTMTQTQFDAYADALKADGSTYLDLGMVWGGRISSPDGIFKTNVTLAPTNGGEVSRHLIFMSDGAMSTDIDLQTSWGIEFNDRRITASGGGTSSNNSRHTSRFLALCEAIKAKQIRVWTISFTAGDSADLKTCASPNSYFNAQNSADLEAAFQEIAKQVGELRLTQ